MPDRPASEGARRRSAPGYRRPHEQDWHSIGRWDGNTPVVDTVGVTIEADVVEFRWVNPHAYLTVVDAKPQAGAAPKTWSIEMSSPGVLTRNGWTKRTFNAGDKITLKFAPLRNGDAGGIFLQAALTDGKVITYSLDAQTE